MIISRTPLRMSFVGGGSDMPEFYLRHGGAVLSTAIDKYIYVNIIRSSTVVSGWLIPEPRRWSTSARSSIDSFAKRSTASLSKVVSN